MVVIRAKYDGTRVIIPESARGYPAGDVLVIFQNGESVQSEKQDWMIAGESALGRVWDNDEDAIYDNL
jgi:hypothetical protein